VSETDSFIEEVSEEVRRDKLYATMRKYGWIAVLLVLALVGGTAYREYKISSATFDAQKTGDAIISAMSLDSPDARIQALDEIEAVGPNRAIIALLGAAQYQSIEEFGSSFEKLEQVESGDAPSAYVELATFKKLLIEDGGFDESARIDALNDIAGSASAYALYAKEQLALIDLSAGRKEAAINRLSEIFDDANVSQSLRQRVSQLMIILGENPETREG